MEAYIERMVEEKRELDDRIRKLVAFRYSEKGDALSEYQRDLLDRQFEAMKLYSNALGLRIFNEKVTTGVINPTDGSLYQNGTCLP